MTICFEEFVKYFIKKWKMVAMIIFVCIAAFLGTAKMIGGEISVPHSEEYLYYEMESKWLEDYLEESSLMKMNPTTIPEITLFLGNVADYVKVKDFVLSTAIWDEFDTERNKNYFYELVQIEEGTNKNAMLTLRHVTEEEAIAAANYLQKKLLAFENTIEVVVGELRIVKDEALQDEHLRWHDRIDYSKSLLLDSQAGYTIKVSMTASAVTGCAAGVLLSMVAVLGVYILEEKSKKKA